MIIILIVNPLASSLWVNVKYELSYAVRQKMLQIGIANKLETEL